VSEKSKFGPAALTLSRFGQYAIMTFGSSLGSTIMARLSLVIARLQFLFGTWIR